MPIGCNLLAWESNTNVELSRPQFDALILGLPWERLADGGVIRIV